MKCLLHTKSTSTFNDIHKTMKYEITAAAAQIFVFQHFIHLISRRQTLIPMFGWQNNTTQETATKKMIKFI